MFTLILPTMSDVMKGEDFLSMTQLIEALEDYDKVKLLNGVLIL